MENWVSSYAYLLRSYSVGNKTPWVTLFAFELKTILLKTRQKMVSWIGQMQEMLQDAPKQKGMKSVSQNSGVVDKSSAGHIFTLALTALALCGHHLETYIHYLTFFLATKRIGIVLLSGMWLFCVPVLPPSMVFCYTIVSRWTCWNALCKSASAPCISAREMSEMQELLPSHHGSHSSGALPQSGPWEWAVENTGSGLLACP